MAVLVLLTALMVMAHPSSGCYQECSAIFNQKIQQLVGVRDTALLSQRSCQAMSEQMTCLERKKATCDVTSLQYVNTILNFIRPDYDRTCTRTASNSTQALTPAQQLLTQCTQKGKQCYVTFNATYAPAVLQGMQNMTAICQSLDNYTSCLEDLMPECGPYIGRAINSIRLMQQQYSYVCSAGQSAQTMRECMNSTAGCYTAFNSTFLPAVNQYNMADMCSAMDNYSVCLSDVHQRTDCQRFTQQALVGLNTLKRQYSMYCAADGGKQAQKCVTEIQQCYVHFNHTYFPAVHRGDMKGICSSVQQYWDCVQPLSMECGQNMARTLNYVRVLKEQFSAQCDPEFQKLSSCRPLMACVNHFATVSSTSSTSLCTSLSKYFPCVEQGLAQCKIPQQHTHVDFSQLGSLTAAYCQHLLGNRVLNTCMEFMRCTSGIVLVSTSDPSAMFDAATWCTYMDMSLSCVERAVNTPSCGLANDDTIKGHLTQQRAMKRNVCKMVSVPALTSESPNVIPVDTATDTLGESKSPQGSSHKGGKAGQEGSAASHLAPALTSGLLATVVSLLLQPF
ncbi:uncharacterized protein LOC143301319 [Babylonia areolata]|uniref:uncharacterized protein LOC143301319 n=1 Tax=Babylonia areolata TaxID=304850 RepID=UPI003FD148DD